VRLEIEELDNVKIARLVSDLQQFLTVGLLRLTLWTLLGHIPSLFAVYEYVSGSFGRG
jgi:hypothetical protein